MKKYANPKCIQTRVETCLYIAWVCIALLRSVGLFMFKIIYVSFTLDNKMKLQRSSYLVVKHWLVHGGGGGQALQPP